MNCFRKRERCNRPLQLRITESDYKTICDNASKRGFRSLKDFVLYCIERYIEMDTGQHEEYKPVKE